MKGYEKLKKFTPGLSKKTRGIAVLALVGALSVLLVGLTPAAASAHVTVNPKEAPKGGYSVLTFRVPNEDDNASTVKLEVLVDESTPIPNGRIKPVPGWDAQVETRTLSTPIASHHGQYTEGVSKITWTAREGSAIKPGEFAEFDVSFGPLPGADKVVFKALQTYDNGTVVRWIDENPEADNPAPTLKLVKAAGGHHGDGNPDDRDGDDSDSDGETVALIGAILGGLALVVALVALFLALRAGRRSSRQ